VSAITTPLAPSDSFSLCRPSQCVPEAASDTTAERSETTACRVTHAVRRLLQELVQRARRRTWHAGVRYRALLSRQGVHTSETLPLACPLQSSQSVKALPSLPHDL
jgi:hypothetical protein